jgi:hypothetical protein
MKKSLVAAAALLAAGGSFAQVSITGSLIYGYESDTNTMIQGAAVLGNPSTKKGVDSQSGFGIDTSTINFTAKEDLGGGTSVTAIIGLDGVSRGGVNGGDNSVTVAGSLGSFKMATARGADYLSGGTSGVGGVGMDNKLFTALTAADGVYYTSPAFSGFKVGLAHEEIALTQFDNSPLGIGAGATGSNAKLGSAEYQRRNAVSLAYASGPLAGNIGYRIYDQSGGSTAATSSDYKDNIRAAVAYDFGSFKLGAGFDSRQYAFLGNRVDTLISASLPLGPVNLGANAGTRVVKDKASGNGTQAGYSVVIAYPLSKRTGLSLNYASWDGTNENGSAAAQWGARTTYTSVLLAHSF